MRGPEVKADESKVGQWEVGGPGRSWGSWGVLRGQDESGPVRASGVSVQWLGKGVSHGYGGVRM
jgi:hypothetical protein